MHVNKLNSSLCPFCHVRDKDLSFVSNFNRCEAVSAIQIEIIRVRKFRFDSGFGEN